MKKLHIHLKEWYKTTTVYHCRKYYHAKRKQTYLEISERNPFLDGPLSEETLLKRARYNWNLSCDIIFHQVFIPQWFINWTEKRIEKYYEKTRLKLTR